MSQISNHKDLSGEFAVLSQLLIRGFDASLTLGNTKGVDILVLDPIRNRMFKVEVKTTLFKASKERFVGEGNFISWVMAAKHANQPDPNLFYCMVGINDDFSFRYFIVPSEVISDYVGREHKEYLKFNPHIVDEGKLFWKFRVALEDHIKYRFPQPSIAEFENNWQLLSSIKT